VANRTGRLARRFVVFTGTHYKALATRQRLLRKARRYPLGLYSFEAIDLHPNPQKIALTEFALVSRLQ
jgi:hypothetical protein